MISDVRMDLFVQYWNSGYIQTVATFERMQFQRYHKFVDDIILASNEEPLLQDTKKALNSKFIVVDLGHLQWFLGIEFHGSDDHLCIKVNQTQYIRRLQIKNNMENCKPANPSMEKLVIDVESEFSDITLKT